MANRFNQKKANKQLILLAFFLGAPPVFSQFSFAPPVTYTCNQSAESMACDDFDADGKKDVVTFDHTAVAVNFFKGNGGGGFSAPLTQTLSYFNSLSMTSGDFNADGSPDLVMARGSATYEVLLGGSQAQFSQASFVLPHNVHAFESADFNNDGVRDLLAIDVFNGNASVLFGTSTNNYSVTTSFTFPVTASTILVDLVKCADINSDGKIDIVAGNDVINGVSVYFGNGNGTFSSPVNVPLGLAPFNISLCDFNNDTKTDLLLVTAQKQIKIYQGNGLGAFQWLNDVANSTFHWRLRCADLNADGKPDLFHVKNPSSGPLLIACLAGDGLGNFSYAPDISSLFAAYDVLSADLNGDSKNDLIVSRNSSDWGGDKLCVLLNTKITGLDNSVAPSTSGFHVFPNPAKEFVCLVYDKPLELTINALTGEEIGKASLNAENNYRAQIRISPPGIYLLQGLDKGLPLKQKLVIER